MMSTTPSLRASSAPPSYHPPPPPPPSHSLSIVGNVGRDPWRASSAPCLEKRVCAPQPSGTEQTSRRTLL